MKPRSLLLRLILFIALLLTGGWLAAGIACWLEARSYINEFYDTQQMLFARHLTALMADGGATFKGLKTALSFTLPHDRLQDELEEEALSFAVFKHNGELLLYAGEGMHFIYSEQGEGFFKAYIQGSDEPWRLFWLDSPGGAFRVAVGQELEYREEMSWDLLEEQFFPWLLFLPALLAGIIFLVFWELKSLRELTRQLNQRSPQDFEELNTSRLPSEVLPLALALNSLFARTASMLERERAFISDASHELKTPLTALRVQAEVAALAETDAPVRKKALHRLLEGIERCSRLIEQLLNLSRLDAMSRTDGTQSATPVNSTPLPWAELITGAVSEIMPGANEKELTVQTEISPHCPDAAGDPALMALLLRNLLENAVRYTPLKGKIKIELERSELKISNSGDGIDPADLPRLGERFFRPPGQKETGSGLGLSIVRRVAALQGFQLRLNNIYCPGSDKATGFCVSLIFKS